MTSRHLRHALLTTAALSVCGCSVFDTETQRSYSADRDWRVPAAFTTADVRVVTQRQHPLLHNDVLCTEPSPDVAKALTSSGSLAGSGGNGAVTASITATASSAEALAELAGRSSALLVVRDSLYRACEAYANGIIGQDAYALVLSRYPQFVTTLFLAQDLASAAAAGKTATAAVTTPSPGGGTPDTSSSQPSDATRHAAARLAPAGASIKPALHMDRVMPWSTILRPAALTSPLPGASTAPAPSGDAAPAGAAAGTQGTGGHSDLALTRMAEDYMHQGLLNVVLVACIDQYDPTRFSNSGTNTFLAKLCSQIDFPTLEQITAADPPWRPVDLWAPEAAASATPAHATAHRPGGGL